MKRLSDLFNRLRPNFEGDGRLRMFKPLFDATDAFFLAPGTRTAQPPHIRDPLDVKRFMSMVIIALAPCAALSVYLFGLRVLALIAVSYAVGGAVEVLFALVRKEEINEGFLVTGLIFPLILPPALPLWMAGVGIAFGVAVGKELFGGTGRNLFNPALVGRCFLALGYPASMSSNWVIPAEIGGLGRLTQYIHAGRVDALTAATPLVTAKQGQLALFSDLLVGTVPGSMGETSSVLIIVGGLFLVVVGVASWRTVVGSLGTFVLLGGILQLAAPDTFGPPLWHLCAGGLLFGTFFMATDPVTSPASNGGKWLYGCLIGAVTLLIRHLTGYVEGAMFAILLGNICAPLFDESIIRMRLRRLRNER